MIDDNRIYVGDYGTEVILDTGSNVSTSTVRKIQYEKPDGTSGEWVASVYNENYIKYTTQQDDIDQAGKWKFRAYIEMPTWVGYGTVATKEIYSLEW